MASFIIKPYSLIYILLFVSLCINAQDNIKPIQYSSTNKKALKYFDEGKRYYDARKDKQAEECFLKAIETDKTFIEPHIIISILCLEQDRIKERIYHLEEAIKKGPRIYVENYFNLAEAEFSNEEYEKSKQHYSEFLKFTRIDPKDKEDAIFKNKCIDFAIEAKKNPKKINFYNAGPSLNTADNEYFPTITADENYFIYTRKIACQNCISKSQEDLFISKKDVVSTWAVSRQINELSSDGNEGAPSISADGNYMFMTISQEIDGKYMGGQSNGLGSCDIFYTQKVNGRWMKPINLGTKINSSMWESQPSFSSDGKTLYFVRGTPARNGTIKGIDIYYSVVDANGKFSQAVKLPSIINTEKDEQSVFIHPDNQTLYFSSEGHIGMGGADIFMSKRKADGNWGEPVNLGYPINTSKDENSLLVSPSGQMGYFASDRTGGFGGLDLYQFEMPDNMRPEKITYVKGKVYNAKTKEPLEASFEVFDLASQLSIAELYSQKNGEFLVTLTANKNYLINVNKTGFLFYSDNFSLKEIQANFNKPFELNIPLEPIDVDGKVELKNIFFDVNKWDIKPESIVEITKLIQLLTKNLNIKIEISGHTDTDGDKKSNISLSTNRSKSVYDYLNIVGKIDLSRLTYKGYGDSQPKVANDTPQNKALNRRIEFKVTSK